MRILGFEVAHPMEVRSSRISRRDDLRVFSSAHVENAKRLLWDSCGQLSEEVNLPFYARRDSENRIQLSANIEDLVAAFDALDSNHMLPEMFFEASDLFRLPPLSLDPVAEQVNLNSRSLDILTTSVKDLECKLSSLFFINLLCRG